MKRDPGSVEILAPAGGEESLIAAVRSGANAVYLGGKGFNARRSAANFDDAALAQAVSYCHVRGVKLYLTLNTLVFDSEIPALVEALRSACAAGVDALIVQDLAVARLAREHAPSLPLHASTQMSVHDAAGARTLAELGFARVVLARELSRAEIVAVHEQCGIELECFVHGALCMSVSGQCYLSSMIGGRSGNRGMCAQPCRLPFSAMGRDYVLSLKDLSLIEALDDLQRIGVCSVKIEGRMKRPEYVAAAVTACRQALAGSTPDYAALKAVFSRSGFTRGYYDAQRGPEMFGVRRKEDVQSAAPVLRGLAALYKDERQSVPVDCTLQLHREQPVILRVTDEDGNGVSVSGPAPQEARTAPTDTAKAAAALGKTGGTPYRLRGLKADLEEGLMLPASQLNALRRDALGRLSEQRGAARPHRWREWELPQRKPHIPAGAPLLRARLARAQQLTTALAEQVEEIVLPAEELARIEQEKLEQYAGKLMVEIPGVVFERHEQLDQVLCSARAAGIASALVGGLGGIAIARRHGFALHGDYGLNITNSIALEEYAQMGLASATVSFELERGKINALGGGVARGVLVYGYLPLMETRNCPAYHRSHCGRTFPEVTDRLNNRFFTDCVWGVARLHNCVPLVLNDRLGEFPGADFFTLYFTRENPQQCVEIARIYRTGGDYDGKRTRGLYYRTVQ